MKTLILHFSDMHTSNKSELYIVDKIKKSLKQINDLSYAIIVISGDLTNQGNEHEFKVVENFIGKLIKYFKEERKILKTDVIVVPGNHDISHKGNERSRKTCLDLIKKSNDNLIANELKKFENFYKFAQLNNCFINDKIIDIVNCSCNEVEIDFIIANSSLFSFYDKKDYDNNDKGIHFIPKNKLEKVNINNNGAIKVFVSHYPIEWFDWEHKQLVNEKIIDKMNIVLTGHEHVLKTTHNSKCENNVCVNIEGGCLSNIEGEFAGIIYDNDKNNFDVLEFKIENGIEICECNISLTNIPCTKNVIGLFSNACFIEKEIIQDSEGISSNYLNDYYVFPDLELKTLEKKYNSKINDKQKFDDLILKKKLVIIKGESESGKTSLCKKIYLDYLKKGFFPIYIDFTKYVEVNIKKIIKTEINNQYIARKTSANALYSSLELEDKVLIIDNADKISDEDISKLIGQINNEFGKIILVGESTKKLDYKKILGNLEDAYSNHVEMNICSMLKNKREILIENIVECLRKNGDYIENYYVQRIKTLLESEIKMLVYKPKLIIQCVKQSFNILELDNKNKSIFGMLYEKTFFDKISKNNINNYDVKALIIILRALAYRANRDHLYPFEYNLVSEIVTNYNEEYEYDIKILDFLYIMSNSKIIIEVDRGKYRFNSKNQFAYLIAKELNSMINNSDEEAKLLFDSIVNNIEKYINQEILLFLISMTENVNLLETIIEYVINLSSDLQMYDVSITKFKFSITDEIEELIAPSEAEREKYNTKQEEIEEQIIKEQKLEVVDFYEEDNYEDDVIRIIKLMSYSGLISRCLYNFNYIIKKNIKKKYIDQIYKLPNKIIYLLFKEIDDDYYSLVDELKKIYTKNKKILTIEIINKSLIYLLIYILSNEFKTTMQYAVDKNTFKSLNNYDNISENYNFMFQKLYLYHYADEKELFVNDINTIIDHMKTISNKEIIKLFLQHAARLFVIERKDLKIIGEYQKMVDSLFSKKEKTELLLGQKSNPED